MMSSIEILNCMVQLIYTHTQSCIFEPFLVNILSQRNNSNLEYPAGED